MTVHVKDAGLSDWEIEDPGDAAALPNEQAGTIKLITAGVETRTLAAPVRVGVLLTLSYATDGGDLTITVASTVNQTGNNTLLFEDIGDEITLRACWASATAKEWRVASNDGVALSTV